MIAGRVRLVLLPLTTPIHLTNYKPRFMLDLLAGPARGCEYLWYFDPDISLRARWQFSPIGSAMALHYARRS